jgi:hypothetical protein
LKPEALALEVDTAPGNLVIEALKIQRVEAWKTLEF